MKIRYLPIGMDMYGATVLVVGAGKVALQKVQVLLTTQAAIIVVAPEGVPEIEDYAAQGRLTLTRRKYRATDVKGKRLVISATNDRALNERVKKDGNRAGIPVNVVDVRDLCDFIFMSLLEREGYVVALSTDAREPGKTKKLRQFMEARIDEYHRSGNKFSPCADSCT
jgi:uroporphyrin-III C-methyltransferase/precorrin-2 dehydrogenase/sirohydrochlorin ferrochelatase